MEAEDVCALYALEGQAFACCDHCGDGYALECCVNENAAPDRFAGIVNIRCCRDTVLSKQVCADCVEVCCEAGDNDDCGGDKNCDGKNGGSCDNELYAEDAQDDEHCNDDEVEDELVCGDGIVNAEEVCKNLACACDCCRNCRQKNYDVEDFKEDFHPGLRIQSREGVRIIGEAAELCKLHNGVHHQCEYAHCEKGKNCGPHAVLREIAYYLVTGGETAAYMGAEPHRGDRKRCRPCALGCFVVHNDSPLKCLFKMSL